MSLIVIVPILLLLALLGRAAVRLLSGSNEASQVSGVVVVMGVLADSLLLAALVYGTALVVALCSGWFGISNSLVGRTMDAFAFIADATGRATVWLSIGVLVSLLVLARRRLAYQAASEGTISSTRSRALASARVFISLRLVRDHIGQAALVTLLLSLVGFGGPPLGSALAGATLRFEELKAHRTFVSATESGPSLPGAQDEASAALDSVWFSMEEGERAKTDSLARWHELTWLPEPVEDTLPDDETEPFPEPTSDPEPPTEPRPRAPIGGLHLPALNPCLASGCRPLGRLLDLELGTPRTSIGQGFRDKLVELRMRAPAAHASVVSKWDLKSPEFLIEMSPRAFRQVVRSEVIGRVIDGLPTPEGLGSVTGATVDDAARALLEQRGRIETEVRVSQLAELTKPRPRRHTPDVAIARILRPTEAEVTLVLEHSLNDSRRWGRDFVRIQETLRTRLDLTPPRFPFDRPGVVQPTFAEILEFRRVTGTPTLGTRNSPCAGCHGF